MQGYRTRCRLREIDAVLAAANARRYAPPRRAARPRRPAVDWWGLAGLLACGASAAVTVGVIGMLLS